MKIRVLYFAAMRDLAGHAEAQIELPPEITRVQDFQDHLARTLPGFAERRSHVRIARNEVFADGSEALREGDVLALIPPVAGG